MPSACSRNVYRNGGNEEDGGALRRRPAQGDALGGCGRQRWPTARTRQREPDASQSTPLEEGGSQGVLPKGDVPGTVRGDAGDPVLREHYLPTLEDGDDSLCR